jgi:hypothetical protein
VRTVSQSFLNICQGDALPCDETNPPGCVNGQCTAVCVGENLPYCPPTCAHYPGVDFGEGHACNTNIVCIANDGRRCYCAADVLTIACAADRPASPTCPYSCRPYPANGDDGGYVDRTDAHAAATGADHL